MKSWAKWTASTVLLATGVAAAGGGLAGAALASTPVGPHASKVPVDVCGNTAAILGFAIAACEGGVHLPAWSGRASGGMPAGHRPRTGNNSVASHHDVEIPTSVCGNAVAVLGDSSAGCAGDAAGGGPDANLPVLGGLSGLTAGGASLPAGKLSAYRAGPGGTGESYGSLTMLAIGTLLAGAAALKLSGGRPRPRPARPAAAPLSCARRSG